MRQNQTTGAANNGVGSVGQEVRRSSATVAKHAAERVRPTGPLGIGDGAPRPVKQNRALARIVAGKLQRHRSRLPVGSSAPIQTIRAVRVSHETISFSTARRARNPHQMSTSMPSASSVVSSYAWRTRKWLLR